MLIAVSLPNFSDTIESTSTNSTAKLFLTTLSLARSEAIQRGDNVAICASSDQADCDAGSWSDGWILFVDNNNDANGDGGSIDGGDEVIRVFNAAGGPDNVITFTTNLLEYNKLGYSNTAGTHTLLICPPSGNAANARSIEVGPSGRGRLIEDGLNCG